MTPEQKAKELVNKYNVSFPVSDFKIEKYIYAYRHAKNAALIAVDEIINLIENMTWIENKEYYTKANYWSDVKQEIDKL